MQRSQNNFLLKITDAFRYITNKEIHDHLAVKCVHEVIQDYNIEHKNYFSVTLTWKPFYTRIIMRKSKGWSEPNPIMLSTGYYWRYCSYFNSNTIWHIHLTHILLNVIDKYISGVILNYSCIRLYYSYSVKYVWKKSAVRANEISGNLIHWPIYCKISRFLASNLNLKVFDKLIQTNISKFTNCEIGTQQIRYISMFTKHLEIWVRDLYKVV